MLMTEDLTSPVRRPLITTADERRISFRDYHCAILTPHQYRHLIVPSVLYVSFSFCQIRLRRQEIPRSNAPSREGYSSLNTVTVVSGPNAFYTQFQRHYSDYQQHSIMTLSLALASSSIIPQTKDGGRPSPTTFASVPCELCDEIYRCAVIAENGSVAVTRRSTDYDIFRGIESYQNDSP